MRLLNFTNCIYIAIFLLGSGLTAYSQTARVNIDQNDLLPELLEEKAEMTRAGKLGERYNIQVYNGDNKAASDVLREVRSKYNSWPSDIIYETPNYKVLIGNFRNRLEADRVLLQIKNDYPAAFIPKPRRG